MSRSIRPAALAISLMWAGAAFAAEPPLDKIQPLPQDSVLSGVVVEPPKVIDRNRLSVVTEEIKMSVRVPYRDLDMATPAGVVELDKRVEEAAVYVCRQLERMYPAGGPERRQCTRDAIDDAQPQVLVARVNG